MVATVADSLALATRRLAEGVASPELARLEAVILLCRVLGVERGYCYAHPEVELDADQQQQFEAFLRRRIRGEPIAYITGEQEFWSLPLRVSPATLIPRPETELLVEMTLLLLAGRETARVADLGTGSGAIALALAHERRHWDVQATDISSAALEVALANRRRLELDNVCFSRGHWLEPLRGKFDALVSNPPYIAAADPHLRGGDCRHEPRAALVAGADGLDAIRLLVTAAREYLRTGGWLLLEHGFQQATAVARLLRQAGYREVETRLDLEGRERVTIGQFPGHT